MPGVNFLIAGVQKAGTTALWRFLRQHRTIHFPEQKELHFFDDDRLDWDCPPIDKLHAHFDGFEAGIVYGEATPIYCYWPGSIERIHRYNPEMKLILLLRHPTFRTYSHWRMEFARGKEKLQFADAISDEGRARVQAKANRAHLTFSYVERSFFAPQIRNLFAFFPRSQIYFLTTDQLWLEPEGCLESIFKFLGVSPMKTCRSGYEVLYDSRSLPRIDLAMRARLDNLFADDIAETMQLTGLNLSPWRLETYREKFEFAPQQPIGLDR